MQEGGLSKKGETACAAYTEVWNSAELSYIPRTCNIFSTCKKKFKKMKYHLFYDPRARKQFSVLQACEGDDRWARDEKMKITCS